MRLRTILFVASALALVVGDPLLTAAHGSPWSPARRRPGPPPPTSAPARPSTAAPDQPTPRDEAAAAEAGAQAGSLAPAVQVADTAVPISLSTARVFATQYAPNTPGSVEVAVPDKCAKFAALRNTAALSQYGCPPSYALGLDYRVVVFADNGRSAVLPVKDVGPWNIDDNYWDFGPGAPRPRRLFADLPAGTPESQAAFYNGYNTSPNCNRLDGSPSGHAGGADQFGRCVLNPAGIDLSLAAAGALGLGAGQNGWVTVAYLWEPVRNTVTSVNSGKNIDVYQAQTSDGAPIIQWAPHGGANQQWRFEVVSGDVYRIVSVQSGKVLDVANRSTADGAQILQWPWNGGTNQQWRFEPVGENRFRIVSVATGKVLDVANASLSDGAPLIQWPWTGGANQLWRLNVVGTG